jgi:hypothetical protein
MISSLSAAQCCMDCTAEKTSKRTLKSVSKLLAVQSILIFKQGLQMIQLKKAL